MMFWQRKKSFTELETRSDPMAATSPVNARIVADARTSAGHTGFTPTRPIPGGRRLPGRQREIGRILRALTEERAHVVLYSERGRGKTSLVNQLVKSLRGCGIIVARTTCNAASTYDSIVTSLAADLPQGLLAVPAQPERADMQPVSWGCTAALPPGPLEPHDVVALPARLTASGIVCIVDEFDRIVDAPTRTRLADTIKQISDKDVSIWFMIGGVSDSLDQILGQHPSIQRALVPVHLPLLTSADLSEFMLASFHKGGVTAEEKLIETLVKLSLGMPYIAQLLGLRVLQAAQDRNATSASTADVLTALGQVVAEVNPRVAALLASLTNHDKDAAMISALQLVARARQDRFGRFEVDLRDDGAHIGDDVVALPCWDKLCHAGVVGVWSGEMTAQNAKWFRFGERDLIHHVLMKQVLSSTSFLRPPALARVVDVADAGME